MSYKLKGIQRAVQLAKRARDQRGGNEKESISYELGAPDALGLWHKVYLESLAARNYALDTQEHRRQTFKLFFTWAAERDLTRASQITRPILESFQRWLWHHAGRRKGQPLGWSTQCKHLGGLKHFFRWLARQNVIVHNPASELEMPRAEKRLPHEVLTQTQVGKLLAMPDVRDPLGVRDRAMLELFYSTGIRRTELCRLDLPDLNPERRTLHVRGKGNKDRVVPVGEHALAWVERYLREVRPRLCLDTHTQALFLTGYGEAFNPDVVSRTKANLSRLAPVIEREMEAAQSRAARTRAEADRQYLAAIVESSDDAIYGKNLDSIIVSWNPAAERIYGYRAEEIIGRSISILFPTNRRDELLDNMTRIRRGELVGFYETERLRKDGTIIPVSVTISPIKDGEGKIIGASTIAHDISKQKKHEEERQQLIKKLSDALSHVKLLAGLLPICSSCKRIRDDQGYWQQVETYIRLHSEATFTHSICPECLKRYKDDLESSVKI